MLKISSIVAIDAMIEVPTQMSPLYLHTSK